MKTASLIRQGLREIDALLEVPPEGAYQGPEPGVKVQTLLPEMEQAASEQTCAPVNWDEEDGPDGEESGDLSSDFDPVFEIGPEVEEAMEALGGSAGEEIKRSVELHGIDALGWYSSFHVTGAQWGVYVSALGIGHLINHVFNRLDVEWETKAHLAFHAILNHELFHFATDYAVAQAELAFEEPWWIPAKAAFRSGVPNYCTQEEKLANGYMLKAFRSMKPALRVRGKQEALKRCTLQMPEGYRDGVLVGREGWDGNLTRLAECYRQHSVRGAANDHLSPKGGWDWPQQFLITPRIDWRYCPIHLVHDGGRLGIPGNWISCFGRLEMIRESDHFVRRLAKMAAPIQKAWVRTREKLGNGLPSGADFKPWPKDGANVWSVRVNKGVRAHLACEGEGKWIALSIGSHKEMGHG